MVISGKNLTINFIGCVFFVQSVLKGAQYKAYLSETNPNLCTKKTHQPEHMHYIGSWAFLFRINKVQRDTLKIALQI